MSSSMGRIIPFLWNGKYNSCSKPPTRWYTSPTRLGKLGKSSNDPRFRLVERLQFFHQANSGTLDAGPLRAPPNSMAIGIWAVKTWHMWHMVYGHHGHPTECGLVPNGLMTIPQSGYIYIYIMCTPSFDYEFCLMFFWEKNTKIWRWIIISVLFTIGMAILWAKSPTVGPLSDQPGLRAAVAGDIDPGQAKHTCQLGRLQQGGKAVTWALNFELDKLVKQK